MYLFVSIDTYILEIFISSKRLNPPTHTQNHICFDRLAHYISRSHMRMMCGDYYAVEEGIVGDEGCVVVVVGWCE